MKSYVVAFQVLLLALLGALVCEVQSEELRIGGIFDLSSGAGVQWGTTEKNSFLLAISDFESQRGTKVYYKLEDSAYSSAKTVAAFQKLTSVDNLQFIIGPTWEVFISIMPICESRNVICIAPSCNNESFDSLSLKNTFTVWFDERDYSIVHAEKLKELRVQRVAVFVGISPYYDSLVEALLQNLDTKPVYLQRVLPTERDFRSLIAKAPKNLDALVVFLLGDGAAQNFYRQWAEQRSDRPTVYTDDAVLYYDPPLDLEKYKYTIYYSKPDLESKNLVQFNKKYKERYGTPPLAPSGSVTYDATMMLLECMKRYRSEHRKVRSCLNNIDGYDGMSGVLSFGGVRAIKERKMKIVKLDKSNS